ncbi:hypothetical protein M422DRAFT_254924 [Sphaerobolus stellatus SS14]|uniref:Uncharacterized protein n=1 Tax=Sphaerobolus stellatus (strain SS14) TaxID=990650 RepID=A0A0C9VJZ1_SPHS4|nr:hypothetical protein M422DRAFT_254924 [Sphaerobolus stellatus SS14]
MDRNDWESNFNYADSESPRRTFSRQFLPRIDAEDPAGFEEYPAENGQDNINQEADPVNVRLGLLGTGQGTHDLTATSSLSNTHIPNLFAGEINLSGSSAENEGRLHAPTDSDIDNVGPSLQEDSALRTVGNKTPRFPACSSTSATPQPKTRNAYVYRLGKDEKTPEFIRAYINSSSVTTSANLSRQHQCVYLIHYNSRCQRSFDTLAEAVAHVEQEHLKNVTWKCRSWQV